MAVSTRPPTWSSNLTFALPFAGSIDTWEKQVLSTRPGVQARRKALRKRHTNDMEVRKKRARWVKKRPRGFK
jgi:hypothetical protein